LTREGGAWPQIRAGRSFKAVDEPVDLKLIYSAIMSLDGYIEDQNGKFDWAVPDESRSRRSPARRATQPRSWDQSPKPPSSRTSAARTDKIVYSRTLEAAATTKTRIARDFVPRSPRRKSRTASASVFRIDSITVHVTFEEGTQAAWLYEIVRPVVAEVMVCNPRRNKLLAVGDAGDLTGSWKLRRHSQGFRQQSAVLMAHSAPRL
jgi:hypothetical protein